jgi:hypothetical protein
MIIWVVLSLILQMKAKIFNLYMKAKIDSDNNYGPISLPNNFPKLFEFDIHDHVSHFLSLN